MSERKLTTEWISGAVCVWFAFCCYAFYTLHEPLWLLILQNLPSALSKLNLRFPDFFWVDTLISVTMLTLNGMVGMLFLRLFIRLPFWLEVTASIFMGIGLANFLLLFLAVFFWLHPISILLCYAFLIGLFLAAKILWGWSDQRFSIDSNHMNRWQSGFYYTALAAVSIITLLSFYHAVLFPVNYWDSLIYYVHYGKMTYEQAGFPILYCLQVGIGLGANYPHLFVLYQAVTAVVFNHWSDIYGQLLCPIAGLGACITVYYLSLHLFQNRLSAILAVLVFRTIPYVTSYIVWASDYALILCFTSLLLVFLRWFLLKPSLRNLQPMICLAAIFPHINYLGWIVWSVVGLALIWHWRICLSNPKVLTNTALIVLAWIVLASTWYVRNYVVTGNPVYAFFPEIFGGENINLEVLRSSEQEWKEHGWGADHIPGDTVFRRIINTPVIFLQLWHFAPVVVGIMLPAVFLGWRRKPLFFAIAGVLVCLYGFYEYFISGFYWYHIIAVFPILAVFVARFLNEIQSTRAYPAIAACVILAGIAPGITVSIAGPKHMTPTLDMFRYPGIKPEQFYRFTYAKYASSWAYLNQNAEEGSQILSHDNRYHVLRDDLQIIHLDDCGLTHLYDQPYNEVHQALWNQGIRYYLYIFDEASHPITQRMGHTQHLDDERYYQLRHQTVTPQADNTQAVTAAVYALQPPQ